MFRCEGMVEQPESNFLTHNPCPNCPSSDAFAIYDDGHGYCFSCGYIEKDCLNETERREKVNAGLITDGQQKPLAKRSINQATIKKWDYQVGNYNGKAVQIANYKDNQGTVIAQKLRFPNKDFLFIGKTDKVSLYGQWLWRDGGKQVTVVEGEIDALSMSQALNNKWAVVSVPHGAAGAKRDVAKALEWLNKFDKVVFMFDNDEAGRKAAQDCASILPPNKAKIASLPMKDANEMLVAGKVNELIDCMWDAKDFRPDGIVNGADLWELVSSTDDTESFEYPFSGLNSKTLGLRKGEIVTITAGSGVGKSQLCREIAHYLLHQGQTIGYIALEESVKRSALGLMSIALNKPLHLGNVEVTDKELKKSFEETLGTGRVYLYDHWGSTESDNLLAKIRYLANGCGCSFIVLDHISIVVSGIAEGDERRTIDNTMTKLRGLVEELKVGLILVSHLKRPDGKDHTDGARVSLGQLRGSSGIAQLTDICIGCERNLSDNSPTTTVRVLKNRWTGETGVACKLAYDKHTARMSELTVDDEDDIDDITFNEKDELNETSI